MQLFTGVLAVSTLALVHSAAFAQPTGMASVPGGQFEMGDHFGNDLDMIGGFPPATHTLHQVIVNSFYMDIYTVTTTQFRVYLESALLLGQIQVDADGVVYAVGGTDPYCFTEGSEARSYIVWDGETFNVKSAKEDHPMIFVAWYGAAAYANWLSTEDGRTPCYDLTTWECSFDADGYRLPTEAEWEYAARGGNHAPYFKYPWGNTDEEFRMNYCPSNDPFEGCTPCSSPTCPDPDTTPVGYYDGTQQPPGPDMVNGYGLYDLAGNVYEWCNDWYEDDYTNTDVVSDNPRGPASSSRGFRVDRGGAWVLTNTLQMRCAFRTGTEPEYTQGIGIGFRLVTRVPFCSDGIVDAGETCDDGNTNDGDGCDSSCMIEGAVPTVSEWGSIVMAMLMMTAGSIIFVRRRQTSAV